MACSLSTTSAGSTVSMPRSPCAATAVERCGPPGPLQEAALSGGHAEREISWVQQLLEDAEAAAVASPDVQAGKAEGCSQAQGADSELAVELTRACAALGRELATLAANLRWADGVVTEAETAKQVHGSAPREFEDPQCFYIGDGAFAQLLADAEAVA